MSTYKTVNLISVQDKIIKSCDAWTSGINRSPLIGSPIRDAIKQLNPRKLSDKSVRVQAYSNNPNRLIVSGPQGYFECEVN
jgi:hypothetical protein